MSSAETRNQARPKRSLALRLVGLYALVFALSIAALSGVVWFAAEQAIRAQIAESVQREAISLADEARATDRVTAAVLVDRRLTRGRSSFYLLQSPLGAAIAGNIEPVAPLVGAFESRIELAPARGTAQALPEIREVIGYAALASDGTLAIAADGVEKLDAAKRAILSAFAAAGLASLALAAAGGLLISRSFLRRVEAINRTAAAVRAGRMEARVPAREDGDEIDALGLNLNAMLERIHALMDNLKQVSSDVAHDLRTPLARLRQNLEAAREEARTEPQFRAAIDAALSETDGLLATFSALLRIAQIESKQRRAAFAPIDLTALLDLTRDTYAAVAEDGGRTLRGEIARGLTLAGDRELLAQMASNLIENALRHTPPGASLTLAATRDGDALSLRFADDGPGIPAEEREKVVRRFYRLERSRTTPGDGLGLALVAAVVELHGGTLRLADARPGLAVEIRLPAG
jgi:signal transduction histidine kinase